MSFINEILEEREYNNDIQQLQEEFDCMVAELKELKEKFEKINEDATDFPEGMSVGEIFDEAQKRLKTARWALGLTNKLKRPEDKKKHRRNIIIVLNKLRGLITKLTNKLTTEVPDGQQRQGQPRQQQRPQGEGRYQGQENNGTGMGQRRSSMAT